MSGFGPIWMEDLMCTGNEDDIALCKFTGWGKGGKCTHLDDVALTCGIYTDYFTLLISKPIEINELLKISIANYMQKLYNFFLIHLVEDFLL